MELSYIRGPTYCTSVHRQCWCLQKTNAFLLWKSESHLPLGDKYRYWWAMVFFNLENCEYLNITTVVPLSSMDILVSNLTHWWLETVLPSQIEELTSFLLTMCEVLMMAFLTHVSYLFKSDLTRVSPATLSGKIQMPGDFWQFLLTFHSNLPLLDWWSITWTLRWWDSNAERMATDL